MRGGDKIDASSFSFPEPSVFFGHVVGETGHK